MTTQFPVLLDGFAVRFTGEGVSEYHINNIQDSIRSLEIKVGKVGATDGTSLESKAIPFFAAGRKLWIYEETTAVPYGWVLMATSDVVLAIKGGSTYLAGGTTYGDWQITGFAHTHGAGTYYFNDYHTHYVGSLEPPYAGPFGPYGEQSGYIPDYQGSNPNYLSGTLASGGSQDSSWRPSACVGIIIKKT